MEDDFSGSLNCCKILSGMNSIVEEENVHEIHVEHDIYVDDEGHKRHF